VNSPVSLSMLTWVTCMGFVGVEMVGRRGELTRLLMKLENVPFFLPPPECLFFAASPSSLYRLLRGLLLPEGGVSIFRASAVKEADWRRVGFLYLDG